MNNVENQEQAQDPTFDAVLSQYDVARQMHGKLNDKFVGLKVAIHQPLAGSTSGKIDEVTETFGDNAKVVLNTFPSYITDLGRSIAGKARNLVCDNAAKVPSTNGHLIHKSKLRRVEVGLLSFKGIDAKDRVKYDEEMLDDAETMIAVRRAHRKGVALDKDLPVTFIGYCDYVRENFDSLIQEILAEYGDNADVISESLPERKQLDRASFSWREFAEIPNLMMFGETSLRDLIEAKRRDDQAEEKIQATVVMEIKNFQDQCRDAVTAVQYRVRSEIAQQLRDFVTRTSQERTYKREGSLVDMPRNITEASLNKLSNRIDDLTSEMSGVAENDEFYTAIQEFKQQLTTGLNMDDEDVRSATSDNAVRIIEMCLDEDAIDSNTGQYFASIIL